MEESAAVVWHPALEKNPAEMTAQELAVWAMREHFKLECKYDRALNLIRTLRSNMVVLRSQRSDAALVGFRDRSELLERNLEIARQALGGASKTALAKRYGVCAGRIRQIVCKYGCQVRDKRVGQVQQR